MKWTTNSAALLTRTAGERRVWFRLVTPELDRDGTITLPAGGRLDNFRARPVFCWQHPLSPAVEGEAPPPPPPPQAVIGKVIEIEQTEAALDILVEFAPESANPQAETCYQLVLGGFLGAVSWCGPIRRQEDRDVGGKMVPHIVEWELWEASLVIVGSNPGAQVIERALRALATEPPPAVPPPPAAAPAPPVQRAAPAARTSPPKGKRGARRMEKKALQEKLAMDDEADAKAARAAFAKYAAETDDDKETRASVMKAVEEHYPEGHTEPDGDEAPADPAPKEPAEKAAEDDDKDVEEMDEKEAKTAVKALRLALQHAQSRSVDGVEAEKKIVSDVDKWIGEGRVPREQRERYIGLHREGRAQRTVKMIPAGTYTTSQRLRSGRVGTPTEIETRSAPRRIETPAGDVEADAKKAADRTIAAMNAAVTGKKE